MVWNDRSRTIWTCKISCQVYTTVPFHSQEWSISNFPCSLTRNITSHSMENLAFHSSLIRWKMTILPILTTSLNTLLFKWLREIMFWNWEWQTLQLQPCHGTFSSTPPPPPLPPLPPLTAWQCYYAELYCFLSDQAWPNWWTTKYKSGLDKVVSDSPGLVGCAVGQANYSSHLPDRQAWLKLFMACCTVG